MSERNFTIERTHVDGVPVFWADLDGPSVGALVFGVGRSSEPAPKSGITHLVEHLALAPLTQQAYDHNGFVDNIRTVFHAAGRPDQLAEYFTRVSANLAELPLDRLAVERRILRQESEGSRPGVVQGMLSFRYGHVGPGLTGSTELGLGWLGPDPVADWTRTWFSRSNAALWLSVPPPSDMRLGLADGPAPERSTPRTIDGVSLPAHVKWGANGCAVSWLTKRAPEAVIALDAAKRRAREVLRFERGVVYDVVDHYEPLDATTAHSVLAADCAPENTEVVTTEILRALDEIAANGIDGDELRRPVEAMLDAFGRREGRLAHLDSTTLGSVIGDKVESLEELAAMFEALTPADIARSLSEALPTMLVASASEALAPGRASTYPLWSQRPVRGRAFRPAGLPIPGRGRGDRLIVGDEGLTYESKDGRWLTVRYADAVACRHWEGGVREVWGSDGFRVIVNPPEWRSGMQASEMVDAAIPPELVACDEHGVGALEDPVDHGRPATG